MRIAVRHWAVAGLVALSAHLGVAATVLVSAPPRGAKAIGADGIEIALGAAGGAPGAVAPVPPAAEPRDVSDAQFVPVQSPETEIARQAIEEVAVEQVSAAEEPVLSVPESVTTPVVAEAVPVQETPVLADAVPPVSRTVRPAETVAINVPVEPKPKRKPAPPVAVKQVAPPREVPAEFRVAEAVPVSQEPVVAGDILQPASGPPAEQVATRLPADSGGGGRSGTQNAPDAGVGSDRAAGGTPGTTADYMAQLQVWLHEHKEYPRGARNRRQEGTVLLAFVMDREGRVLEHRIRQGSGHRLLDEEVVALIRRANPLPPPPPEIPGNRISFVVPVQFFLR